MPGNGGCYFLPRIIGTSRALELLLTGRRVDAEEALAIGLVSRIVPFDDLPEAARALASEIATFPSQLSQMIKRTVRHSSQIGLAAALDMVSSHVAVIHASRAALD